MEGHVIKNAILAMPARTLRRAAAMRERIEQLEQKLIVTLGVNGSVKVRAPEPNGHHRKRRMSAAGRARLSAIAKSRWKVARKEGKSTL